MNARIRQFLHDEWLQLVIIVVPLIAAVAAMPFATEPVPMQWNLRGQVNWYAPKEWGLLVLPLAMVLTFGILFWREALDRGRLDPEDGRLTSHGKATRAIRLMLSLAGVGACFVQIASAIGRHPDMGRMAAALCPLLLAFAGNLFGKLKPNRYMGIRVPWTLRSETVWRKTHRVAGWLYTVSGLIVTALCLLAPARYFVEITVVWLAVIILIPLVVAWQAAREEAMPAGKGMSLLGRMAWLEAAVLIAIIALYFHQVNSDPQHAQERRAAQAAAEKWLANLDEGRYEDAWKATGNTFRTAVTQEAEVNSLNKHRKPAGVKVSRQLREAKYTTDLPRAPAGQYVVVQFDTVFQHRSTAIETVVEEREKDGQWKVSGYSIR